ncbi:hypothetical protein OAO55_02490 [Bacteroidales bacterium]|nr:hypothetical protein [Bacteroidales bacterium]
MKRRDFFKKGATGAIVAGAIPLVGFRANDKNSTIPSEYIS